MVMVRCPLGQSCVLSPSPPPRSLLNGNRKVSHFKIGVKRLSNEVCMCVWVCLLVFLFSIFFLSIFRASELLFRALFPSLFERMVLRVQILYHQYYH